MVVWGLWRPSMPPQPGPDPAVERLTFQPMRNKGEFAHPVIQEAESRRWWARFAHPAFQIGPDPAQTCRLERPAFTQPGAVTGDPGGRR